MKNKKINSFWKRNWDLILAHIFFYLNVILVFVIGIGDDILNPIYVNFALNFRQLILVMLFLVPALTGIAIFRNFRMKHTIFRWIITIIFVLFSLICLFILMLAGSGPLLT